MDRQDLQERLSYLESTHDWNALVETLEEGIAQASDNAVKAALHLQLGQVLETKFLATVKALKHFQDAYKQNPALLESLECARGVYWSLGKINMVKKLIELELKAKSDGAGAAALLVELGDVLCDMGQYDDATAAYARAVSAAPELAEAGECLEDVQADSSNWQERVAVLLRKAHEAGAGPAASRLFMRASRIARRFAPEDSESMVENAYRADPMNLQAAAVHEGILADRDELKSLEALHTELMAQAGDRSARAQLAFVFGSRWAQRHQNPDVGTRLLEESIKLDPRNEGAFQFLRDFYGAKGGDWPRVVELAEEASTHAADDANAQYLLVQAGTIAWREIGNLIRARASFERLCAIAPEHPQLRAFELQIGESIQPAASPRMASQPPHAQGIEVLIGSIAPAATVPGDIDIEVDTGEPSARATSPGGELTQVLVDEERAVSQPPPADEPPAADETPAAEEEEPEPAQAAQASEAPPAAEAPEPTPAEPQDDDKVAELKDQAEKQLEAKRFNEYVRTLLALADAVTTPEEKVDYLSQAADLFVNKFANQAEAVKAFEAILDIDVHNDTAISYLRQMYEKRRDWEKLIRLEKAEADRLEPGPERTDKLFSVAKLASERVKKPEICIGLWQEVIESDDTNAEALAALSQLYERTKDFEKLAETLEKQVEVTYDDGPKAQMLSKLGTIYGDRMQNDELAVRAWRALLDISPNDRKAQEQLKKRYIALQRWDDLEAFYADTGKWDEFIRVLEQQESREQDEQVKIGLLFKVALLWDEKKQKADRAARAYEKILAIDATNLRAAEALIPIYSNTSNAKALTNALEVKLGHEEIPDAKLELLRELAGLYEGKLRDQPSAFERYLAAFAIVPSDEQATADVERAAKAANKWDELVDSYGRAIEQAEGDGDAQLAVQLRLKLGRVLVDELGNVDRALEVYRAVYEADPDEVQAISALERLYRETSKFPELLEIYEKKRDISLDPDEKKAISYEIAGLFEKEMNDVDRAVDTYNAILDDDPADERALGALDVLYGQLERWEPYVDIMRRRIDMSTDPATLVDLKFRLGQTVQAKLDDAALALDNYRQILEIDRQHDGAREALEGLLENADLRGDAAAILAPIYEERGAWKPMIQALEILSAAEGDVNQRVELHRKIAQTAASCLEDYALAFDALAQAVKDDPSNPDARREIEQTAQVSDAWPKLVALYTEVADALSDPDLARELWMKVASLNMHLGQVDEAAASLYRILAIDSTDEEALSVLENLFVQHERWSSLVEVIERRIEQSVDPAVREDLLVRVAQIHDERLEDADSAIAAYRRVLEEDPAAVRALGALDELLTRQEKWPELAENLEAQLSLAGSEHEQLSIILRLAALRESKMAQIEAAIEGYRTVLERDTTNADALSALERIGQAEQYELVIADLLEPFYRNLGDYPKLIQAHEVQVRRSDDVIRRVELLHQISQLHEDAAGNLGAAFDTLRRALHEDPAHEETRERIDRVARATGRFADLAQGFEEEGSSSEDPILSSDLLTLAARVHEQDLGDADAAIALYRRVLQGAPENLPAAESLERIFRTTERYPELSAILQQKANILEDLLEQKEALFQAAAIEEDVLEQPEKAIAVYNKVLELDSEDVGALDALIRRYLGLSRWQDLMEVYARKADLVIDPEEKKRIFYQVGAVYERELGDAERAIDTYQKVLELDPDDLQALSRLDVLYEQSQNWQELLSVLQREADMTEDPVEATSFQYRIAELYEKRLEDVSRAIELYRDLLERLPDHGPTLDALEGLKNGEVEPVGAASVLEPVYEACSDWQRLISVLEVQVRHESDQFRAVDLLHRIARLYEDALGDHNSAFDTYARAVASDNGNDQSLSEIERLATALGRWADVGKLYDAELDKLSENPDRYVELGLRVAQIYEQQLEDLDTAIRRYQAVSEVEPANQTAIRSLDRLFEQTERWADLARVLAREAEIGETPDEILSFQYRLGQLQEKQLGNLDAAIVAYRDVLAAAPEHELALMALEELFASGVKQTEIAEILEPLYRQAAEWTKLGRVYEAQLAHTPAEEPDARLQAYFQIAELHEEKLMDPVATLETYIRALKEFPLDDRCSEDAPRVAAMLDGGWETLANAYADILGLHQDPNVQRKVGKRLAATFEDELGDITKAEETYKYVLGVEPLDVDALANLDRIYASLESAPELAQILELRVQATEDEFELVELYARLGTLYEERLGQIDDAIRAYRKIFDELDRTHEAAIDALARIFEESQSWKELDEVYTRQLENAAGDVAEAEIRAKIATLAAQYLNDPERAIETWKVVLDLRGEDPEALGHLANLYESLEHWRDLVEILERQFEISMSDEERVNILTRRARLFSDKLDKDELALEDWNRILDIDYANLAALRSIANIRRRQEDGQELVVALHQIVDRAAALLDEDELIEIFRELGRTYGQVLHQEFDAADAWRRLLEVRPDFEAMDALENIYRGEERWVDVIDIKMQRADALEDPLERVEELRSVAAIWTDTLEDPDAATPAYQKILEVDPQNDEAYSELESRHATAARWEPLIELYLGRLDTREEVSERTELLRRIARVFEEQLEDKNQALDALLNALAEDFHDRETARYLERMAQATGRWGEVIQLANEWLKEQTEPSNKIRLCLHLAKWYGDDLGHPEFAQPYYAQIVQLDPNNVGALRQMGQLYRKSANWQQLGATLTRALDVAVSDVDRKEIMTELGELLDEHMDQTDQAITYFQRALEVDGQHLPALEHLERIYGTRGNHRELVDVLQRKVSALSEVEEIVNTKLRIASLYETNLGDPSRSAAGFREVLNLDPENLQAMRGLVRTYEVLEQWPELVQTLERELEVVTTERERMQALMHLARLQEEQFVKPDIAAQRLEQVLEIDPSHEEAYFALERCYGRLRQWLDLINAYERHVSSTVDRQTKIDIYANIARVYADEVEDTERAIDAYLNIVDLDDTNIPALEALAKLYERQDDAAQSIEYMTRVAELTQDTTQRVEAFYRIGRALDEKLGDRISAQERYEMALDLDPSHLPSLGCLREISLDSADYDKAARYIDQEQSHTQSPRQRAKLLVELGRLRDEKLGEHEGAVLAWQAALEADPENEDAALPLIEEYIATENWEAGEPLLEMVVRKSGKRERGEQHDLHNRLGYVCAQLGQDDKALRAYTAAHQLDLTNQDTIRGLADVSFRLGDWGAALTNYQKVLTSLEEGDIEQRAEVYYKLGCIKRNQGQAKQAINNFEKALGVDPNHRETLEALVSLFTDLKDWRQVVAYKRQILDNVFEADDRLQLLLEIGDIWADNEKNAQKAIEALEEARDLKPNDHAILHKLLALYQQAENWTQMIDTISSIAELESDPIRRSKFIYTMAQIYRDKEGDQDRAVELFNDALDMNPTLLEAFERINKILTARKDWKALERAFRKMLRRLSAAGDQNSDLEYNLWHNLGLIYRDRLHDTNSAIEAFKMATRYKPDEPVERQILAELFEATEQLEAAVGEHSIVLQKDPLRVDPYRSLRRLYQRQQEFDRAWCMCAALAFLKKADDEEQRFFEDYRPRGMIQVKSRLDNEQWVKNLLHKDENLYIGKIFEMITPAAIVAKTNQLRAARQLPALDARFKQDPATSTVTFAKTFGWAANVLGVSVPELYVRNDVPGALVAVPSSPPASVAGQTVLTGFNAQELTFIVGKHLAYYRGEHYIRNLFPTLNELKVLLFAAIKLVMNEFAIPQDMAQAVGQTAQELVKYMQPIQRDSLRIVVKKFVEDGARVDLKRWMQAVEVTACRAGLLLCADLEIAKKIIAAEPQVPGDLPPGDKMKELLVFSVSEQYFALRSALGIAVG